ncbi:uncharacterized protein LOC62_07G009131 [Vanrija pseudolonga]|uniref:Uncharacterized protein n=1 Tax=Vanrija pseudolonga TaxID=143232 RepID=A0AAF1BR88_9TREE|nr:hypothetical protein LOC62_07G009131 [Vanrija pseudolonga]
MCEARRDRAGLARPIQPIPTPEGLGGRLELEELGAGEGRSSRRRWGSERASAQASACEFWRLGCSGSAFLVLTPRSPFGLATARYLTVCLIHHTSLPSHLPSPSLSSFSRAAASSPREGNRRRTALTGWGTNERNSSSREKRSWKLRGEFGRPSARDHCRLTSGEASRGTHLDCDIVGSE